MTLTNQRIRGGLRLTTLAGIAADLIPKLKRVAATEDQLIRATIERYQSTFSAGDREAWLALFADDASLEDPVGSPPRQGRDDIAAFWDEVHRQADAITVRMVQG